MEERGEVGGGGAVSSGCGWLVQDALKVLGQDLDDGLDVGPQLGHGARAHGKLLLLRLVLRQETEMLCHFAAHDLRVQIQ